MSTTEPRTSEVFNGYETKNLNKAAYLLMRGALYKGCRIDQDNFSIFILDQVNKRHRDDYWKDDTVIELWTFVRTRKYLKDKVKQKMSSNGQK